LARAHEQPARQSLDLFHRNSDDDNVAVARDLLDIRRMSACFLGEILERLGAARIRHGDLVSGRAEAARQRPADVA
jgi:hypothetical protein